MSRRTREQVLATAATLVCVSAYVIVNGRLVLDQGKPTGARPGR